MVVIRKEKWGNLQPSGMQHVSLFFCDFILFQSVKDKLSALPKKEKKRNSLKKTKK
jgi:hypothetical protein